MLELHHEAQAAALIEVKEKEKKEIEVCCHTIRRSSGA